MERGMTAKDKILWGFDVAKLKGIEIGPLVSPLISKEEGDVRYVDRASTSELREWYSKDRKIDPAQITEIDYVWGDSSLAEATGHLNYFDYCVAAHVIEHVPDLIGWLQEISAILKIGGVASFSIPDRRYTFDYLRKESTLADCVEAYLCGRRKPSIRHIFDHFSLHAEIDIVKAWQPEYDGTDLVPGNTKEKILEVCRKALEKDSYIDSHCWVFTKESFIAILNSLQDLDLVDFKVKEFFDVEKYGHEFVVQLEKISPSQMNNEKKYHFSSSLRKTRSHLLTMDIEANKSGTAQLYYDTGAGFNETESQCVTYPGGGKVPLEFTLPARPIIALRFDPAKQPVKMKIFSIKIALYSGNPIVVELSNVEPYKCARIYPVNNGSIMVKGHFYSNDPGVTIRIPTPVQELM